MTRPWRPILLGLVAVLALMPLACGGGGGGGGGGGAGGGGEATLVKKLSTPLGAQGNLGDWSQSANSYIDVLYNLADKEYSKANVKVEFAVDWNADGFITADEWRLAQEAPGQGDGTEDLKTSPGSGSRHHFVWDSSAPVPPDADTPGGIGAGRYVTLDFRYDPSGRPILDEFGNPEFLSHPGARVRVSVMDEDASSRESNPFDASNNSTPYLVPEIAKGAQVSEGIDILYRPVDANGDTISIAVDYSTDNGGSWLEATPAPGTQITGLSTGVDAASAPTHTFEWDTVADLGTVRVDETLVRVTVFDEKNQHGEALEIPAPFVVENWEIFTRGGQDMSTPRVGHSATRLMDGSDVLIAGGRATPSGAALATAELFYPSVGATTTGTLAATGSMATARADHATVRLYDGRVMVIGGEDASGVLGSVEIYDPSAGTFSSTGSLSTARKNASAALMISGMVLVAGGMDASGPLASTEIYDPSAGTWSAGPAMNTARYGVTAAVLGDHRVVIAGGMGSAGALDTAEVYDPVADAFLATVSMTEARSAHAVTRMVDGRVLLSGGMAGVTPTGTLETFDPTSDLCEAAAATLTTARSHHSAVELGDGRVLILGGMGSSGALATAQRWNPSTDQMEAPKGTMKQACADAGVAVLANGRPVIFGGSTSATAASASIDVYTPAGGMNEPPVVSDAKTVLETEFPALGVRVKYWLEDAEGDAARIRVLYTVDGGDTWHPCTPRAKTILGDINDGTEDLAASAAGVEHTYVWDALTDIGRIDVGSYDDENDPPKTRILIIPYGAEEGEAGETPNFVMKKNAPVGVVIDPLVGDQFGAVQIDFTLSDGDDDPATMLYQYGIDTNSDGLILAADGESWVDATAAAGSVGTGPLDTLDDDENPIDYTFYWDSVRDMGAPRNPRSDIVFRIWGEDADPGIPDQVSGFDLVTDPNGLFLVSWHPQGSAPLSPSQSATGVELDRPIVFNFNADVDGTSVDSDTIQIRGSTPDGYYDVDGDTVTFYPQVPDDRSLETFNGNSTYSILIPGYDPDNPVDTVLRAGGTTGDYNSLVCLLTESNTSAFTTNTSYVSESDAPEFDDFVVPMVLTGVLVGSDVQFEIDEPINPSSIMYPYVKVLVSGTSNDSVIPGSFSVTNYVGPDGIKKSVILFEPAVDLPPDATIKLVMSGLLDFAGNSVSSTDQTFTTETGSLNSFTQTEDFLSSDTSNRDDTETNAYWGTAVASNLTGLVPGGDGTTEKKVTSDETLTAGVYKWSKLTIATGVTLRFTGSAPVEIYVREDAIIDGTIDVSGGPGGDSPQLYMYMRKPTTAEMTIAGGTGGPNGGDGGAGTLTALPTSSGQSTNANGSDGTGSGPGKGGKTVAGRYYGYSGGGGGHATAGSTGDGYGSGTSVYTYGTVGAGGSTYGQSDLSLGMAGGSGGGGGSGGCYYYSYYRSSTYFYYYYRPHYAGGGGGGGSVKIETGGKLVVHGVIDASGGRGGNGAYYGGSGGGGSGGDIWLRAGEGIVREGLITADGGVRGYNAYYAITYSSYPTWGGTGGKGRIHLEEPSNSRTAINAKGAFSTDVISSIDSGSGASLSLKPTSDTTLTTNSSNGGVFRYTEVNIPSGVTVYLRGDRPARIIGRDGITVTGAIVGSGGKGSDGGYKSSSGYTSATGGVGYAGGYAGGRSHTVNGRIDFSKREDGEDGKGPGGGEGGGSPSPLTQPTYTYYTYSYFYYPGAGGSGSFGRRGEVSGLTKLYVYSYQAFVKPYTAFADVGDPGDAYDLHDASGNAQGGSGGAGGACGGYTYSNNSYKYSYYGQGGSGGGGGASVTLETPKTLAISGTVNVAGGIGGVGYSTQGAGGGGGSGGSIVCRAGTFGGLSGTLDASGGTGGRNYTYTYYARDWYGYAGDGGDGYVRLEATTDMSDVYQPSGQMIYGSLKYEFLERADRGVTKWVDTGALNPTYTSFTASASAATAYLEVAHTKPDSDERDDSTATKMTLSDVAAGKADGYRFYRFFVQLLTNTSSADIVKVDGTYRAK